MSILAHEPKSAKSFTCAIDELIVNINGNRYEVHSLDPGECGTRAYRLDRLAPYRTGAGSPVYEASYDVIRTPEGLVECSCPHYEYRLRGNNTLEMCKHGRALVELSMLEAPAPCCPATESAPCAACDAEAMAEAWDFPDRYPDEAPELPESAWWESGEALALAAPPAPEPMAGTLDFPGWVEAQAVAYRALPGSAGPWLASELAGLAARARRLQATTPAEYEARAELEDQWRDDELRDEGFQTGRSL